MEQLTNKELKKKNEKLRTSNDEIGMKVWIMHQYFRKKQLDS